MQRNKFNSNNHTKNHNNKNNEKFKQLIDTNVESPDYTMKRYSFTEKRLTQLSGELNEIKPQTQVNDCIPLKVYKIHIEKKLNDLTLRYPPIDKQYLPPMDSQLNPLFFPFNITTSDQIVLTNLKSLICRHLTNNYFIQNSIANPTRAYYNSTYEMIKKMYDLNYKLSLTKAIADVDETIIPFLHNESGQFRPHEMIQGIGVAQHLYKMDIALYTKIAPGSGDYYVNENGEYVILDIKSADLKRNQIKELLIKNITKYKKFKKSYLCLNGNETNIKNVIKEENIKLHDNIQILYQNTQENFKNKGFYSFQDLDEFNHSKLESLYHQLSQPRLKPAVEKLLNKHTHDGDLDLTAFEKDLNQFLDLDSFIDCQNEGDNFFDSETISDFKKFTSHFNDNNDNDGTGE